MRYIQFAPKALPSIAFAVSLTKPIGSMKKNIIDHRKNMIEFSINTEASFTVRTQTETIHFRPHDLIVYLPDRKYIITSDDSENENKNNTTFSIAVTFPDLTFSRYDTELGHNLSYISDTDVNNRSLLLPECIHLEEKEYREYTSVFRVLINSYFAGTASEYYHAIARWYDIAAMLDSSVRTKLQMLRTHIIDRQYEPSQDLYIKKAKKYIFTHYSEKLTVPMIAEYLNITPNYLSTLFKKGTGESVIDFLNYYRMLKLRELLLQKQSHTLSDLCAQVGIQDKRYAQRLFKKHFGVSMQRCLHLETGITMLHEDPWDVDGIESDLYLQENKEEMDSKSK